MALLLKKFIVQNDDDLWWYTRGTSGGAITGQIDLE